MLFSTNELHFLRIIFIVACWGRGCSKHRPLCFFRPPFKKEKRLSNGFKNTFAHIRNKLMVGNFLHHEWWIQSSFFLIACEIFFSAPLALVPIQLLLDPCWVFLILLLFRLICWSLLSYSLLLLDILFFLSDAKCFLLFNECECHLRGILNRHSMLLDIVQTQRQITQTICQPTF